MKNRKAGRPPPQSTDNRESQHALLRQLAARPWIFVVSVALLVRVAYFVSYLNSPLHGVYLVDHEFYRNWAKQIAAGDWLGSGVFVQGPLYAYFAGTFYRLGASDEVIIAVQLLLGALNCGLIYACGRRLFDLRVAVVAGLLAAVFGPLMFYECLIMKTSLSPLLTTVALYGALRSTDQPGRGWLWLGLSGFAVGLACLVRENHSLLLAPLLLWIATCRSSATWLQRSLQAAALLISLLLAIAPATIRNYAVAQEWILVTSGGGEVFYMGYGPDAAAYYVPPKWIRPNPAFEHEDFRVEASRLSGRELTRGESSRYWFRAGLSEISRDPLRALRLAARKVAVLLNNFESPDSENYVVTRRHLPLLYVLPSFGWIMGLGLVGGALALRDWRRYQLLLGMIAAHAFTIALLYNFGRFRAGLFPPWILLAAFAAVWLWTGFRARANSHRKWAIAAAVVVVLASLFAFAPPLGYGTMQFELHDAKMEQFIAVQAGDRHALETQTRDVIRALAELRSREQQQADAQGWMRQEALQHFKLATMLLTRTELREAEAELRTATRLDPAAGEYGELLASLLAGQGRDREAAQIYADVVSHNPQNLAALHNGAVAAENAGDYQTAADAFSQLLAADPSHVDARCGLANSLWNLGRADKAIEEYRTAVRLHPDHVESARYLAWILATRPDADEPSIQEAVTLAERVHTSQGATDPAVLDTLAVAYARAGRFPEATDLARRALHRAHQLGDPALAQRITTRLELYQSNRPFIQPPPHTTP